MSTLACTCASVDLTCTVAFASLSAGLSGFRRTTPAQPCSALPGDRFCLDLVPPRRHMPPNWFARLLCHLCRLPLFCGLFQLFFSSGSPIRCCFVLLEVVISPPPSYATNYCLKIVLKESNCCLDRPSSNRRHHRLVQWSCGGLVLVTSLCIPIPTVSLYCVPILVAGLWSSRKIHHIVGSFCPLGFSASLLAYFLFCIGCIILNY